MQPSPAKFSARAIKASWWLGTASLAFGLFIKITSELLEHEVSGVDHTILIGFAPYQLLHLDAILQTAKLK